MSRQPELRRAAVAGTWYPSRADALAAEVDAYLVSVPARAEHAPTALIAPHAGLMYSGPVAAHAYARLRDAPFDIAVLIGPSHYVAFEGVALYPRGAFETPFGPMAIDEECGDALRQECSAVCIHPAAHAREHSLEMQLPFLKRLRPDVRIVPLIMGHQSRETAFALGRALAPVLADRQAVVVASSDLSHYHDAATASALDARVIDHVPALDADGLMSLLERRPEHACGGGPMVAALIAAAELGATKGEVLCYADSGDVSGDKSSVVGYLAAAASIAPGES